MFKIFAIALMLLPISAHATKVQTINKYVPNAEVVGAGTYREMFSDVYKAELYAPSGKYKEKPPYALSINYFMDIDGKDIAKRSVEEMQKNGISDKEKLESWQSQMEAIFPDVKEGSKIIAVAKKDGSTIFISNGVLIGTIKDKDFAPCFFGIWLDPKTSDEDLRKQLLGEAG